MKTKLHSLWIGLTFLLGLQPAPAPVARPTLSIAPAGQQALLYWPAFATAYVLQSSTNLASTNWVFATDAVPATYGSQTAATVTQTARARFFRLIQIPTATPDGMTLIPAGPFTMGNSTGDSDIFDAATVTANLSAFYLDTNLVSTSQWQAVYNWATNQGYVFDFAGAGKAANHPVQTVNWYDTVKWCNARSQQAGLMPVYYTNAALTQIYTFGETTNLFANWTATGYRLPTEAEWEKAARGGLSGQRFPRGNTISESQANYFGDTNDISYDLGPSGFNALGSSGGTSPATSPVGSFVANGYGLFDMAGNVEEWCWDYYVFGTPYAGGSNPRGPASGNNRVLRGGSWNYFASYARCANRDNYAPNYAGMLYGFRCARGF